jgi:peptide deformylase
VKPLDLDALTIVKYPDPVLKTVAEAVVDSGSRIEALAGRMIELMRRAEGVGLAAPQVGVSLRLFVCNPTGDEGDDRVCINPEIVESSGAEEAEEGCLSIPGVTVKMRRATQIVLRATGLDGKTSVVFGEGLTARVWQHEADHLDGRLIIDNMSTTDEITNRRAIKQLERDFATLRR